MTVDVAGHDPDGHGPNGPADPRDASADRAAREATSRILLARAANGDAREQEAARQELVTLHQGMVEFIARKYRDRGEPQEDLVQVGMIGLLKAIDGFDPDRGSDFGGYAFATILGSIQQYFRDDTWSLKVSRRIKERIRAVSQVIEEVTSATGTAPTVREIADALGLAEEDVLEAMDAAQARAFIPLDAPIGEGTTVADGLGGPDDRIEQAAERADMIEALRDLPEQERMALLLTTVEGLTQAQAAERMGMSQMSVHRKRARAQERLRRAGLG